jgi:hypothetical protein
MRADEHSVHRWRDSGQVPCKEILKRLGLTQEELERNTAARDVDTDAFIAEYQRRQSERTPEQLAEERAEARAAHGPGVELVNIFTGDRFIT